MTKLELIKQLLDSGNLDEFIAVHIWTEDDIVQKAGEMGVSLSDEEIEAVAARMMADVDPEMGMTWTFLEECIDAVIEDSLNE